MFQCSSFDPLRVTSSVASRVTAKPTEKSPSSRPDAILWLAGFGFCFRAQTGSQSAGFQGSTPSFNTFRRSIAFNDCKPPATTSASSEACWWMSACHTAHTALRLPHRFPIQDAGEGLVQGRAHRGPRLGPRGPLKTLELQDAVDGALEMFAQHVVLLAGRGRRAGP